MRPALLCLCVLAACTAEPPPSPDTELEARRIALGLSQTELSVAEAMGALDHVKAERFLQRVGSRRLAWPDVLDTSLRIENAFGRLGLRTTPGTFGTLARQARADALALARAAAAEDREAAEDAAGALLASCVSCHVRYRHD